MSPELSLFPETWRQARTADPSTSKEAVIRNQDGLNRQRKLVLTALVALGPNGGTCYDVGEQAGITHVQAARRLFELGDMRSALARTTGERRKSPKGDGCRIWVPTRKALRMFENGSGARPPQDTPP